MKISKCNVVLRKVDGTELDIVNAARVSFHKESEWENKDEQLVHTYSFDAGDVYYQDPEFVGKLPEKDIKLINYLARHGHWTPFGHVGATFAIKAPIFMARQLGKHQVGLVWNEVSRRYVDDEPEFWFPEEWRGRPVNAKQGSSGVIDITNVHISESDGYALLGPAEVCAYALKMYNELLRAGVAPEQARLILPQNMMTEWWWTGSLAAFARVFKLRLDPHTQKETQEVAQAMYDALLPNFPNALKALME